MSVPISIPMARAGFDSEKVQQEAQSRITKFQVAGDREKERALKVIAADTAQKQKRAAEVAAQAAAGLAETRDSVSASIASDTALKAFSEDAAGASERASAAPGAGDDQARERPSPQRLAWRERDLSRLQPYDEDHSQEQQQQQQGQQQHG